MPPPASPSTCTAPSSTSCCSSPARSSNSVSSGRWWDDGAIFASITSEPGSSFRDKLAIRTSIRHEDGKYKLSGTKHFCSLSTGATYYFTWSLLDGVEDLSDGLLNVLIRSDQPGIEIMDDWDTIGMRGTVSNSIRFNDVEILPENVVGEPGAILGKDMSIWSTGYTGVYFGIAEGRLRILRGLRQEDPIPGHERQPGLGPPDTAPDRRDGHAAGKRPGGPWSNWESCAAISIGWS